MPPTLVLVDRFDVPEQRMTGGVELLFAAIGVAARSRGLEVCRGATAEEITRLCQRGPALVFTQQEGRLSPTYRAWADSCLAAGATIVEKNVFALASAHRPRHPRYVHALMSHDGAHRFALRSAAAALPAPSDVLLLPNPLLMTSLLTEPSPDVPPPGPRPPGDVLRLLRVGRPDPIKWSAWEQQLAVAMVRARPGLTVHLTLVGVPDSCLPAPGSLPPQVVMDVRPMLPPADLLPLYAAADAYVHHSRIGETYGNAVAEAQAAGCFCVVGLSPAWDCAPVETLAPEASWVGHPDRALAAAGGLVDAIRLHRRRPGAGVAMSPEQYVDRLIGVVDGSTPCQTLPSTAASLRYLIDLGRRLDGVRGAVSAPPSVAVRAAKGRWRPPDPTRSRARASGRVS